MKNVIAQSIKEAIDSTSNRYKKSLKSAFPAFKNRLQERNLTFNFSFNYLRKHRKSVVWQEVPIKESGAEYDENRSQHIDTVIINNENNAVIFIEAKCISRRNVKSRLNEMFKDLMRLKRIASGEKNEDNVLSINNELVKACEGKDKYFLILADVWSSSKKNNREKYIERWIRNEHAICDNMPNSCDDFRFVVKDTGISHIDADKGVEETHHIIYAFYKYL